MRKFFSGLGQLAAKTTEASQILSVFRQYSALSRTLGRAGNRLRVNLLALCVAIQLKRCRRLLHTANRCDYQAITHQRLLVQKRKTCMLTQPQIIPAVRISKLQGEARDCKATAPYYAFAFRSGGERHVRYATELPSRRTCWIGDCIRHGSDAPASLCGLCSHCSRALRISVKVLALSGLRDSFPFPPFYDLAAFVLSVERSKRWG